MPQNRQVFTYNGNCFRVPLIFIFQSTNDAEKENVEFCFRCLYKKD